MDIDFFSEQDQQLLMCVPVSATYASKKKEACTNSSLFGMYLRHEIRQFVVEFSSLQVCEFQVPQFTSNYTCMLGKAHP